jgi:hypothetical protein
MLSKEPDKRLTASELLEEFNQVSFEEEYFNNCFFVYLG